jgi:hypothetical protein
VEVIPQLFYAVLLENLYKKLLPIKDAHVILLMLQKNTYMVIFAGA